MKIRLWLPLLSSLFHPSLTTGTVLKVVTIFSFWGSFSAQGSLLQNIHPVTEATLASLPWPPFLCYECDGFMGVSTCSRPLRHHISWAPVPGIELQVGILTQLPVAEGCRQQLKLSEGVRCSQQNVEVERVSYSCSADRLLVKQGCSRSKSYYNISFTTQLNGLVKDAQKM